jgi:hypothetical protein
LTPPPLSKASALADWGFHERDHWQYWSELMEQGAVPGVGYDEFPRGRVSYNGVSLKFMLVADRCILRETTIVESILRRLTLAKDETELSTDTLYRCSRCKSRAFGSY